MIVTDTETGIAVPNKGGQADFAFDWEHGFIGLEGGWMSGKTWAGARKLVSLHLFNAIIPILDEIGAPVRDSQSNIEMQPTYIPSAVVAPTYGNARDYDVPAIEEALEESNVAYRYVASGKVGSQGKFAPPAFILPDLGTAQHPSVILIRTAERPDLITGWQVGAGWGDEPARWGENRHDPKNDPYIQFLGRIRDPNARLLQRIFTWTNEGDDTRIFLEFSEGKPDHALYRAATDENPKAQVFYDTMLDQLPPDYIEQYLKGSAIRLSGRRVYVTFEQAKNVDDTIELSPSRPLHMALDFNIAPGMHALIGQYEQESDLLLVAHEIYEPRLDVRGVVRVFSRLLESLGGWKWPELHIFGDATGKAASHQTGRTSYEILQQALAELKLPAPIKLFVPAANPLVVDRANAFNMAMYDVQGAVHWKCHSRCKRLLDDLKHMKYTKTGELDKTEKKMSHASDAEGYRVSYLRPVRVTIPDEFTSPGRFNV